MEIRNFFVEKGQGEALILLHGNGEDSSYFVAQIEEFSKYYHVYALDTRGHGRSPRGRAEFTIRQFAEDLKAFFDRQGIEKAHVLGFSDGANIAMIFALRYPQLVDRLILNGGNLNGRGVKDSVQLPIVMGYKLALKSAARSDSARRKAELLGLMVNDPDIEPAELFNIKAKTLVLAGDRDMIKEDHTRLISCCIPNGELCIIKGDHFIAANATEEYNQVVLEFLRS